MHKIDGQGAVNGAFVAENTSTGQQPTVVTPEWLNAVQDEILAVLAAAGIAWSKSSNVQLAQAVQALIEARVGDYVTSTNSGNAYTVVLDPVATAYTAKTSFAFKASAANTGACTLNAGAGVVSLLREDGTAMQAGDIGTGAILTVVYDTASGAFRATEIVASQVQSAISSYAPSKTGTGASGSWAISITGNAATASSVDWLGIVGKPSNVSTWTNDAGYLTSATGVTTVNGAHGAVTVSMLGVGQTYQVVTGSRVAGTTYTNSTGKSIYVSIWSIQAGPIDLFVDGISAARSGINSSVPASNLTAIIPIGSTYSVSPSAAIASWSELR